MLRALHGLPVMSPAKQALMNLWSKKRAWHFSGEADDFAPSLYPESWCFSVTTELAPPQVVVQLIDERKPERSLWLGVTATCSSLGQTAGRLWYNYEGADRILAWILAHEPLLMALDNMLTEVWVPVAVHRLEDGVTIPELRMLASEGFSLKLQADQGDLFLWLGLDEMGIHSLCMRLHHILQETGPERLLPAGLAGQHLHWYATIKITGLGPDILLQAKEGDWLVLGRKAEICANVEGRVSGVKSPILCLELADQGWIVRALREAEVDPSKTEGLSTTASSRTEASLNTTQMESSTRLEVDLRLGGTSLTLAELSEVKPGFVLSTPQKIDQARVDLYVNEQIWARGQLVSVEDRLAVHIFEVI